MPYFQSYILFTEDVNEVIAFTAYSTLGGIYYDAGDVIIFDAVQTNIGGYFQTDTSTFTCVHHGIYIFSWTLYTNDDMLSAELFINDESHLFQTYTSTQDNQSQSMTIITECNTNQKISLRSHYDDSYIWSSSAEALSSFSGCMLHTL